MAAVHWYVVRVWNETFFNRGTLSRKQLEHLMGFVVERVREKGGGKASELREPTTLDSHSQPPLPHRLAV